MINKREKNFRTKQLDRKVQVQELENKKVVEGERGLRILHYYSLYNFTDANKRVIF